MCHGFPKQIVATNTLKPFLVFLIVPNVVRDVDGIWTYVIWHICHDEVEPTEQMISYE